MILKELLELHEAGKVHTIGRSMGTRGAPEEPARAFDKKGTNRSVIAKLEKAKRDNVQYFTPGYAMSDGDSFIVLVMSARDDVSAHYHGVNVYFNRDGTVDGIGYDKQADDEWERDKAKIIAVARKDFKKTIEKHMAGKDVGEFTDLPRGR